MPKLLPDETFYPSPTMAMQAPVETLAYVALLNPDPARPEEVARTVTWLCEDAARGVNGQAIVIDGGGLLA